MTHLPDWVIKLPQTPLEEKINGIKYPHLLICSGDRYKPLGTSGCCCLNILRQLCKEKNGQKKEGTGSNNSQ